MRCSICRAIRASISSGRCAFRPSVRDGRRRCRRSSSRRTTGQGSGRQSRADRGRRAARRRRGSGFRSLLVVRVDHGEPTACCRCELAAPDGVAAAGGVARSVPHAAAAPAPQAAPADPQLLAVRPTGRRALPDQREAGAARRRQQLAACARPGAATRSTSRRHAAPSRCATAIPRSCCCRPGVGATPVLAMLHALAAERSTREVWWLHGARDGVRASLRGRESGAARSACRTRTRTSGTADPAPTIGRDATTRSAGRLSVEVLRHPRRPAHADAYLCGPDGVHAGARRRARRATASSRRVFAPRSSVRDRP